MMWVLLLAGALLIHLIMHIRLIEENSFLRKEIKMLKNKMIFDHKEYDTDIDKRLRK